MTVGEWLDQVAPTRSDPDARDRRREPNPTESLDQRLDDLNRRLKQLASGSPAQDAARSGMSMTRADDSARRTPSDAGPLTSRLDHLERRLSELAGDARVRERRAQRPSTNSYEPRSAAATPSADDDVERMRRAVQEIEELRAAARAQLTAAAGRRSEADRGRPAEPLPSRTGTRPYADGPQARPAQPSRRAAGPAEDPRGPSMAELTSRLEGEIRMMRHSIEARIKGGLTRKLDEREMAEIRDIGVRLDQMAEGSAEPRLFDRVFGEYARLRDVVFNANLEGSLRSLEAGYGHVVGRLDDLKRSMIDPRVVERIGAEIGSVRDALRDLPDPAEMARVERRIESLAATLDTVITSGDRVGLPDGVVRELKHSIEQLDPTSAMRQIGNQLFELSEKIDKIEESALSRADAVAFTNNQHLSGLVERLTSIASGTESRSLSGMKVLDERMSDVATRIGRIEERGVNREEIADLTRMVAAINAKIDRPAEFHKPVVPASLIDFNSRLERLSTKLDRIDAGPVANAQLTALETEIAAMRHDLARVANSSGTGQIESQIRQLGDRIDLIARDTALPDRAISEIVERTIKRLEATSPALARNDLAAFEARFSDLATALERIINSGSALDQHVDVLEAEVAAMRRDLSRLSSPVRDPDLEDQIRLLSQRMGASLEPGADHRILEQIEEQISRIADRLNDHEQRFADIGGIEAKLGTLESLLAERHDDALAAASTAAREAVREFGDFAAGARQSDELLLVLESDLKRVEDASRTTELRTSEALHSVHDALSTIIDRLGSLERGRQDLPPGTTAHGSVLQPGSLRSASADGPATNPEDHRPLEPGSGKPPVARAPAVAPAPPRRAAPAEPAAAARPQDGWSADAPVSAGTIADPESATAAPKRTDFIAAARRAAKAAAQTGGAPSIPPPVLGGAGEPNFASLDLEPQPRRGLSGLLSLFKGRTRTVALAGGIIIVASGALTLAVSHRIDLAERGPVPAPVVTGSIPSTAAPAPGQKPAPELDPVQTGTLAAPDSRPSEVSLAPPSSVTSTFVGPAAQTTARNDAPAVDGIGIPPIDQSQAPPVAPEAPAALELPNDKIGSLALRQAAVSGDSKAQFEVGMRFAEGRGVAADQKEATAWYERAAVKGFIPAAYRLGSSYEKGLGVARDTTLAKRWYTTAAEGGNIRAMHNLGVLYANERDMAKALPWFLKASDLGLKDSQFNLGIIFALGSGVKADIGQSYKWFAIAAAAGDQEAARKRDDVGTHLDKSTLTAAKLAASSWRIKPMVKEANEEAAVWVEPAATAATPPPRTQVMQVQSLLQSRGLYSGPADGTLSTATRAAIKLYQKKTGQRATGEIDDALVAGLAAKAM